MTAQPAKRPEYLAAAPRWLEVGAGLAIGVLGVGLTMLGCLGVYRTFVPLAGRSPTPASFIVVLAVVAAGTMCSLLGWRLLLRRPRASDGGLLSPTGLRLGALIFIAGPVAAFFVHPVGLLHVFGALTMAGACLALARQREYHLRTPTGRRDRW